MKTRTWLLLAALAVILAACGGGPKVKLLSAEYVPSFASGGVTYNFTNQDIVQIQLDFTFDPAIAEDLDPAGDDYRAEIYKLLVPGAHFFYNEVEVPAQFGYWPEEAGADHAKALTLFYLLPKGHDPALVRFAYDGDLLGEGGAGLATALDIK